MGARLGLAQERRRAAYTDDELEWQHHAACRGRDRDYDFHPEPQAGLSPEVKAICRSCPVRSECLAFALKYGESGIWGGLTEPQRRELKNQQKRSLAPCGTTAAFQRHVRHGEKPCDECRAAKNAASREWFAAHMREQLERREHRNKESL